MLRISQLSLILIFVLISFYAQSQGCVAIRGFSGCSVGLGNTFGTSKGEIFTSAGFRYFKSFRHFRGRHEEHERLEENTEVINNSYFLDLSLTYGITDRWYASATLPFLYHNRSSLYEHGRDERHETSSKGLADVRLGVGYWLFDPASDKKYNYAIGLGVKLPTGDYSYKDTFRNQGDAREDSYTVVDQSIQPGDGGTAITMDVQGYHILSDHFVLTASLFYLFNPKETNGVLTRNGNDEFSCPDQFAARIGAFYNTNINGFSLYGGVRLEGVPSSDAIGSSAGYRRPGYAISVEPGIVYSKNNMAVNLSVPIALERNRIQSYSDKQRTAETGEFRNGDAAFADYLVNLTLTFRFGGKHKSMMMDHVPEWSDVSANE